MSNILLKNVELYWVKVDQDNPDQGFDKQTPQWCVDARTRDKAVSQEWKKLGFNVQVKDDDNGVFYNIKIKKPQFMKSGKENRPIPVVGRNLMPLGDVTSIGNGSMGNVSVHSFEYNYNGREGVGFRLEALQITELKEYAGASGGNSFGFAALDDVDSASDTSNDEVSLYD